MTDELRLAIVSDSDWGHAFQEAGPPFNPLTREVMPRAYVVGDIKRVVAAEDGENDGPSWLGVFEMNDGKYLTIRASCDYTGWDCKAGGSAEVTWEEAEAIACLSNEERERLGL